MKFRCTVVEPNGDTNHFDYNDVPPLSMLKQWVGGYIEAVPFFDTYGGVPCVAFCNEEGKLEGLPKNPKACLLWGATMFPYHPNDVLVGSIVIITAEDPADLGEL